MSLAGAGPGRAVSRGPASRDRGYHSRDVTVDERDGDAAMIGAIADGNDGALRELYDRYGRIVYAVAYRVTGDAQLAEECTQDVFVRVWRRAGDFDPARAKVSTWLFAIARNRAIELWRSSARRTARDVEREREAGAPDPAELTARADEALRVADAMAALPEEQHEALQLAYFEDLSQAEIADRLGLPLGTVKSRIRLALERLRGLADEFQLEGGAQ